MTSKAACEGEMGQEVFGVVYLENEKKLSIVVDAELSDNKLIRIGRSLKNLVSEHLTECELLYDINDEQLLVV